MRRGGVLLALVAVGAALIVRYVQSEAREPILLSGTTMGSLYHVTIDEELSGEERARARAIVEERFTYVDHLLSTYDSTSEVSRFNRHASTEPFAVSAEVLDLLVLLREVSESSGGALDVTVAPLVDAWGFGPVDRDGAVPDDALLAELMAFVGYERLLIDEGARTVAKSDPRVRIDLSSIGQGYAVEVVASALEELGLTRFLVEMSGELMAVGTHRDGTPWRVGIEAPEPRAAAVWGTIDLGDEGISTAGDYLNYVEVDGVRYAHLIDPRMGRPVRMIGAAVSVVHESVTVADAWDTALAVLGPDAGFALAEREGLAAFFITRAAAGGFETRTTTALAGRVTPTGES
ncbi:MAG: FAD:protein FMN transferase [Gemmatimonadales bacterium]